MILFLPSFSLSLSLSVCSFKETNKMHRQTDGPEKSINPVSPSVPNANPALKPSSGTEGTPASTRTLPLTEVWLLTKKAPFLFMKSCLTPSMKNPISGSAAAAFERRSKEKRRRRRERHR